MSSPFLEAVEARHTYYSLTPESPIPDSKIEEIVKATVLHSPSTMNVQSARAVVLFREKHQKFWDIAASGLTQMPIPEAAKTDLLGKLKMFRAAYGTVLWYEDQATLDGLAEKHPAVKPLLGEFSDHSTGIHHFVAWTALDAEGLGASLQHYGFVPGVKEEVAKTFNLPDSWVLKAQLVFGTRLSKPDLPRTYEPIEPRVLVQG